jgi:hypothetical protein
MNYLGLKLNLLITTIGVTGLVIASDTRAQPTEKNGFPCVAEVCLGDGVDDLRRITTWERAMSPYGLGGKGQPIGALKVDASSMKSLATTYPNLPAPAAPYLLLKKFDGQALPALAAVNLACDFAEIEGVYTSESGHPTTVKMALAAESNTKQRWAVTMIRRLYPSAVTAEQKSTLELQLRQKYSAWDQNSQRPPKSALRFSMQGMGTPGFTLHRVDPREQTDMLKQHTACGGARKIKIE